jgi:coenzyme F420 hydrogenase subunit beta
MSVKMPVDILFQRVVDRGLCTRCGTCAGACPSGNIKITDPLGSSLPRRGNQCTACGLCLQSCPGEKVDFIDLASSLFDQPASNPFLGVTRSAYLSYAVDPDIRKTGASGGVATALQLFLMRRNEIKGSVLYGPSSSQPWRGEGKIARTEEEIKNSAQSWYHLSPMNSILSKLKNEEGKFALVGLPCHVHGLRKLQKSGWKGGVEISPVIGIYCGNNLYYEATRVMLRKLGVKKKDDIVSLHYREGEWPGNFTVTDKKGVTSSVSKLDFNQLIPFYINHRCLTCIDLTNELADVSIGDGWAKEGESEEGWSLILTRSELGEGIVKRAAVDGVIELEAVSIEEAVAMHSHAFDLKKIGAPIRLSLWRKFGRAVPEYRTEYPPSKFHRRIAEVFISLQFIVCSSVAGRALLKILPLRALGLFFRFLRRFWIKASNKILRST